MESGSLIDAKEHLAELAQRAARGEEVRITDPAFGTAQLTAVPVEQPAKPKGKRLLGQLEGMIPPPPDSFFDPLSEEELKLWYGDEA